MTEGMIGEEQYGIPSSRGCIDKVFVMKQMSKKFVSKNKERCVAYIDFEKADDRIDRYPM